MLICNFPYRSELDDKMVVDEDIGEIIADNCSVFVVYNDWMLLLDAEACLPETMRQRVFIYFFVMPVSEIDVNVVGDLPDLIAHCFDDVGHGLSLMMCVSLAAAPAAAEFVNIMNNWEK